MGKLGSRIISDPTPRSVAGAVLRISESAIAEIESSLPLALAGERSQVSKYVEAYRELTSRVMSAVADVRPDLLVIDEQGRVIVAVDFKARRRSDTTVSWVRAALEQEASSVPFSDWVGTLGTGRGTAVAVVALLRAALPGADPLPLPRNRRLPQWPIQERDVMRFSLAVANELSRRELPLDHLASVFDLSRSEVAALFGVRRQAIDQWEVRGVPAQRQEKLTTLGEIVDFLEAKLKRDRIPGVVRRSSPAYGDRSILQAITADEQELVLAELRDAFDWASAA